MQRHQRHTVDCAQWGAMTRLPSVAVVSSEDIQHPYIIPLHVINRGVKTGQGFSGNIFHDRGVSRVENRVVLNPKCGMVQLSPSSGGRCPRVKHEMSVEPIIFV